MHGAIAALTKQPVFILNANESQALTDSLCNVLDYHKINITDVTGPWGLYVALGLTAFMVYKPRLDYIKAGGGAQIEQPSAPATPGDAEIKVPSGGMDFSADIDPSRMTEAAQTYN